VMAQYFQEPYPARAAIGVASLPKGVAVEMDAVLVLTGKQAKKTVKAKPNRKTKKRTRR